MVFMNCRRIFCGPMNIINRIPPAFGFGIFLYNIDPKIDFRTTSSLSEFREMIRSSLSEVRSLTVGQKGIEEPKTFIVCFLRQSSRRKGKPPEIEIDNLGKVANDNFLEEQKKAA